MSGATGEMPFLDHLEELRGRLIRALLAVVIGFGAGLWLVQRFQLVSLLKAPIAPYLSSTGGKLAVLSPTEPVMIVLKLGFIVGLVLASPIVIYQIWAFLAPALYAREKRAVLPALFAGLVLFLIGGFLGYAYLLPQALGVLFSFQSDALALVITYDEYFGFVLQIVLALGISFELPLVLIILSALGIISPAGLSKFRRYAVVLCCIAGAILSPGTDVLSMIIMTIPLLLLYEVGFIGSWLVHRRRVRQASAAGTALLLLLFLNPGRAEAQQPTYRPPRPGSISAPRTRADSLRDSLRMRDSTRLSSGQPLDTATARRLGLPTAPSQTFPAPDSTLDALLARPGFEATRFMADSASLVADAKRIFLMGKAMTERRGSTMEADTITYSELACQLNAKLDPHLFDAATVLVGDEIHYNTCTRRGVVANALTTFHEGGAVWFLRGDIAQDSSSSRIYAASSEITSCDLPVPHYHFSARQVKWISKTVLVARPAVLYVRDVPILWLPFIFQDARPGRHSGILVPQFGLNDLVRPNEGYNRQLTNVGYYWAPNEYFDLTGRLDWYANRYTQFGLSGQYRILNRFLGGSISYDQQRESGGSTGTNLRWDHRQNFNLSTSLNLSLNYSSNTSIIDRNAIDPLLNTRQILSQLNFSKRYNWGTVTLGGNRRQSLSDNSTTTTLPSLTVSPKPLDLSRNITWSPGFSLTNDQATNTPQGLLLRALPGGAIDSIPVTANTRATAMNFDTPVRFGGFIWRNSISVLDRQSAGRERVTSQIPDSSPGAGPVDSITVNRFSTGSFSTGINWDTGINLPTFLGGTWKVQPSVGIANATSAGPFLLRNQTTNGAYVRQGKRFSLSLTSSPTLFGFFPGFGPIARIRHSFSPIISYNYSPAASVPLEYARAVAVPGQAIQLRSDATQTLSIGLSQNFEGKGRPAPNDTSSTPNIKKFRLLSISTSPIAYDFEQAKLPGKSGWRTPSITNSFQSDLVPGFNLSLTHDLWRGVVGTDTAHFDPFLTSVTASFALSGGTIHSLLGALGIGKAPTGKSKEPPPPSYVAAQSRGARPGSFYSSQQVPFSTGGRFNANFNYTLSRSRPNLVVPTGGLILPVQPARQNLGISTSFSPTPLWNVSWSSQYNITANRFESQQVRLDRNLHEWRAGFNFVRNPNGNFAFYFSISLTDLPELKFDYNQTTLSP
ncbi:MAG: twin-arginine translocase subunit TatC [Gemmatimonadota bacterium]